MVGPIALTTLMGAISYMWLTVVGHPLWRGLGATLSTRGSRSSAAGYLLRGSDPMHPGSDSGRRITHVAREGGVGWPPAFALAVAMAVLAAAIPAAMCPLMTIAYPTAVMELPTSVAMPVGFLAGLTTWIGRATIFGMPRVSRDVEIALALAVVALTNDDPGILARIGRHYEHYILDEPRLAHYRVEQLRTV